MPFYGRYIQHIVLTTAGGILAGSMNDSLLLPSFIAPFLTAVEPTDSDSVIFYDNLHEGGEFVIQWDKHVKNDDKNRLKFQLRILLDGTLNFVYKHFTYEAKSFFENNKLPIMIGIKDGFSAPVEGNDKGKLIFNIFYFLILILI